MTSADDSKTSESSMLQERYERRIEAAAQYATANGAVTLKALKALFEDSVLTPDDLEAVAALIARRSKTSSASPAST